MAYSGHPNLEWYNTVMSKESLSGLDAKLLSYPKYSRRAFMASGLGMIAANWFAAT